MIEFTNSQPSRPTAPTRRESDTDADYERLCQVKQIKDECQAAEIDGMLVDMSTASICFQVAEALTDGNRASFLGLPVEAMGRIAWRLAK